MPTSRIGFAKRSAISQRSSKLRFRNTSGRDDRCCLDRSLTLQGCKPGWVFQPEGDEQNYVDEIDASGETAKRVIKITLNVELPQDTELFPATAGALTPHPASQVLGGTVPSGEGGNEGRSEAWQRQLKSC